MIRSTRSVQRGTGPGILRTPSVRRTGFMIDLLSLGLMAVLLPPKAPAVPARPAARTRSRSYVISMTWSSGGAGERWGEPPGRPVFRPGLAGFPARGSDFAYLHEGAWPVFPPCSRVMTPRGRVMAPLGRVMALRRRVMTPRGRVITLRGRVITLRGRVIAPPRRVITLRGRVIAPPRRVIAPP